MALPHYSEHLPPLEYQLFYSEQTFGGGRYKQLNFIRLILDATFTERSDIQYDLGDIHPIVNDERYMVYTKIIKYCQREMFCLSFSQVVVNVVVGWRMLMFYHPTIVLVFSSIYDSNLGYDVVSKVVREQPQVEVQGDQENVLAKYIPFKFAINVEFILCETENIILVGLKLVFFIS